MLEDWSPLHVVLHPAPRCSLPRNLTSVDCSKKFPYLWLQLFSFSEELTDDQRAGEWGQYFGLPLWRVLSWLDFCVGNSSVITLLGYPAIPCGPQHPTHNMGNSLLLKLPSTLQFENAICSLWGPCLCSASARKGRIPTWGNRNKLAWESRNVSSRDQSTNSSTTWSRLSSLGIFFHFLKSKSIQPSGI